MVTALVNGILIDGNGGASRPGSTVVVDGESIAEVSQQRDFGSEVRAVDVGGKTIMPVTELPQVTIALFADPEGHVIGLAKGM